MDKKLNFLNLNIYSNSYSNENNNKIKKPLTIADAIKSGIANFNEKGLL